MRLSRNPFNFSICFLLASLSSLALASNFSIFSLGGGNYMIAPVSEEVSDTQVLSTIATNRPPVQEQNPFEQAELDAEARLVGRTYDTLDEAADKLATFLDEGLKREVGQATGLLRTIKRLPQAFMDHGYATRSQIKTMFQKTLEMRRNYLESLGVAVENEPVRTANRNELEGIGQPIEKENINATRLELFERRTLNFLYEKAEVLGLNMDLLDKLIGKKNRYVSRFGDTLFVTKKPSFVQWQFDNQETGFVFYANKDNKGLKRGSVRLIVLPKKMAYMMKNATTYKKAFEFKNPYVAYFLAALMRTKNGKIVKPKEKLLKSFPGAVAESTEKIGKLDVNKPFIVEIALGSKEIIQNIDLPVSYFSDDVLTGLSFVGRNGDEFNFVSELIDDGAESNFMVTNTREDDDSQLNGKWAYQIKEGIPTISLWVGGRKLSCTFVDERNPKGAYEALQCKFVDFSGVEMQADLEESSFTVQGQQPGRDKIENMFKRSYETTSASIPLEVSLSAYFESNPELELDVQREMLKEKSISAERRKEIMARIEEVKEQIKKVDRAKIVGKRKNVLSAEERAAILESLQYDEQIFEIQPVSTYQLIAGNTYTFKSKKVEHFIEFGNDALSDEEYEETKQVFVNSREALEALGKPTGLASLRVLDRGPRTTPESFWYYVSEEPTSGVRRSVRLVGVRTGIEMDLDVRNLGSVLFNETTGDQFTLHFRDIQGIRKIRYED